MAFSRYIDVYAVTNKRCLPVERLVFDRLNTSYTMSGERRDAHPCGVFLGLACNLQKDPYLIRLRLVGGKMRSEHDTTLQIHV
jgi:hypothetical protein